MKNCEHDSCTPDADSCFTDHDWYVSDSFFFLLQAAVFFNMAGLLHTAKPSGDQLT